MSQKEVMQLKYWLMLFFCLLLPISLADKVVFDKDVYPKNNFTLGNITYVATTTPDMVILKPYPAGQQVVIPQDSNVVANGYNFVNTESGSSVEDYMEKYNLSSPPTSMVEEFYHHLKVYEIENGLKVTKTIKPTSAYLFDYVNITLLAENTGSVAVKSFTYSEQMPSYFEKIGNFKIVEGDDEQEYTGSAVGNGISWKSSLLSGQKKSLVATYRIKGVPVGSDVIKLNDGSLSCTLENYPTSIPMKQISGGQITLIKPLSVETTKSATTIEVGQKIDYKIRINNLHSDKPLDVTSLQLILPQGITVDRMPTGFKEINPSTYVWKGDLEDDKNFTFSLDIGAGGSPTIVIKGDYKLESYSYSSTKNDTLTVKMAAPVVTVTTAIEQSGKENQITYGFEIENPNKNLGFSNLKIDVLGEEFENKHYVFMTLASTKKLVQEFTAQVPVYDKDTKSNYTLKLEYYTQYGQKLEYSKAGTYTIPAKVFEKALDYSVTQTASNDKVAFQVDLKKENDEPIDKVTIHIVGGGIHKEVVLNQSQLEALNTAQDGAKVNIELNIPELEDGSDYEIQIEYGSADNEYVVSSSGTTGSARNDDLPVQEHVATSTTEDNKTNFELTSSLIVNIIIILSVAIVIMIIIVTVALRRIGKKNEEEEFMKNKELYSGDD